MCLPAKLGFQVFPEECRDNSLSPHNKSGIEYDGFKRGSLKAKTKTKNAKNKIRYTGINREYANHMGN